MAKLHEESYGSMSDPLKPAHEYLHRREQFPSYERVDWKHAPAKYKQYNDCECISLGYAALAAQGQSDPCTPVQLGRLLADTYGVTRQRWTAAESYNAAVAGSTMPVLNPAERAFKQELLRPVPSGGGLFPCELYLITNEDQAIPGGVYHYDALHHALDSIQRGSYLSELIDAVAPIQCRTSDPLYALVLSCAFQKDAFKYGEFGYRLQGLDIGIVLAQCLEVLQSLHLQGYVQYQFLDEVINSLLGLDSLYESAYVVVLITQEERSHVSSRSMSEPILRWWKPEARREQLHLPISCWPFSAQLHQASIWREKTDFVPATSVAQPELQGKAIALKKAPALHLAQGSADRHSARHYFLPGAIQEVALSAILEAAARGHTSDRADTETTLGCQIYCIINNVTGFTPGVYCYQPSSAHLLLRREEDMRVYMQQLVAPMGYNNAYHISIYICLVGRYENGFSVYGNRWYRMLNLEAGMAIQRVYLAAALLGLGCHTSLAYPIEGMDRILQLPAGYTTLAQIMIAPEWIAGQYYEAAVRSLS
jgi:SagB-type dehydrogenase domain